MAADTVDPQTFPYLPPKLTAFRMRHFDPQVFKTDEDSHLYKLVDALAGDVGAGQLKKNLFITRLSANLNTMYFRDLDDTFGNFDGLVRLVSESYEYDPTSSLLTSDEWDEIQIKDTWYRQRIKDFFTACSMGGTPNGIRMMIRAALGVDCDIFEVWRYIDDYNGYVETEFQTLVQSYGRTAISLRNEFIVKPHKESLTPQEWVIATRMVERIKPADTIVTIDAEGLSVHSLVPFKTVAADSSYFIVERKITGVPELANLTKPEIDLANLQWIQANIPNVAPTNAFGQTQEHSYYYMYSETDSNSPIDSIVYQAETSSGIRTNQAPLNLKIGAGQFTDWLLFDLVDSPDNFPGGKFGQTPSTAPALYPNGGTYQFPYQSQGTYIQSATLYVQSIGGTVSGNRYRFPIAQTGSVNRVWEPKLALSITEPTKDSTVSTPAFVREYNSNPDLYYAESTRQLYTGLSNVI